MKQEQNHDKTLVSHAEIGRKLGISEAASRQAEQRGLQRMRRYLEFHGLDLHDLIPNVFCSDVPREIIPSVSETAMVG